MTFPHETLRVSFLPHMDWECHCRECFFTTILIVLPRTAVEMPPHKSIKTRSFSLTLKTLHAELIENDPRQLITRLFFFAAWEKNSLLFSIISYFFEVCFEDRQR